jgi:hypothetical protein
MSRPYIISVHIFVDINVYVSTDKFIDNEKYGGRKMKSKKLIEAIELISGFYGKEVVSIMYEDGSGHKFLYKLEGDEKYTFVDINKFRESMSNIIEIARRHGLI